MRRERPIRPTVMFRLVGLWQRLSYEIGAITRPRQIIAAFAVNPIVGAAVFAASKVLGPLWSKVSILRYHISGPLVDPQINEVLRQPRKENAQ